MHNAIISYINNHNTLPLTAEEEDLVKTEFQPKKLRKKQYFLQEGDVSNYTGFIVGGAMYQYNVDEKGTEHITNLYIENYWATDRESSIMLTPSKNNIQAWEDTHLLIITRAELIELMEKIPALVTMFRTIDERNAIMSQRRLNSTISDSAEKKYEEFMSHHRQFVQRFPQHMIASYLGITKETLSRVKKQVLR